MLVGLTLQGQLTEHQCSHRALLGPTLPPCMFVSTGAKSLSLCVSQDHNSPSGGAGGRQRGCSPLTKPLNHGCFGSCTFLPGKTAYGLAQGLSEKGLVTSPWNCFFLASQEAGWALAQCELWEERAAALWQKGDIPRFPGSKLERRQPCPAPRRYSEWGPPGQVSWECPSSPPPQQSLQFSNRWLFGSSEVQVRAGCSAESRARWGWGTPAGECQHQHERLVFSPGRCSARGPAAWPGASEKSCSLCPLRSLCSQPDIARILALTPSTPKGSGGWDALPSQRMLTLEWESEGLQTVGIVVIICASLKLLHLLGLIDFSEGKVVAPSVLPPVRSGWELDTDAAEVEAE